MAMGNCNEVSLNQQILFSNTEGLPIEVQIIDCNDCGHCVDLHAAKSSDPQILKDTRNRITDAVGKWFSPKSTQKIEQAKE